MGLVAEARHRRRAGLRGHACAVPRRAGRPRLSRKIHRRSGRARSASADAHAANGRRRSPGLSVAEIEAFARLVGTTKRTFFRLGYGFSRQRNGAVNMHAALSIAAVTGAWQYEGGGAFHSNSDIFKLDKSELEGTPAAPIRASATSTSRKIGRVLTGDADALYGGPPVTAMLVQNTNPANVAPEQRLVKQGLLRDDLFTCVHEQFMTDTARLADVVLPATMFLEHDDIYRGGGNQHIMLGPKLIDPPEGPRTNHFVIEELAKRLGVADMPGFGLTEQQHIDIMLGKTRARRLRDASGRRNGPTCSPISRHRISSTALRMPDGKFRFRPDWTGTIAPNRPPKSMGTQGRLSAPAGIPRPCRPDRDRPTPSIRSGWRPRRRASFLNSTFTETPCSQGARGPAGTADPSRRRGVTRPGRRRPRRDRQYARRGRAARKAVRRRQARRGDRRRASGRTARMSAARASTC